MKVSLSFHMVLLLCVSLRSTSWTPTSHPSPRHCGHLRDQPRIFFFSSNLQVLIQTNQSAFVPKGSFPVQNTQSKNFHTRELGIGRGGGRPHLGQVPKTHSDGQCEWYWLRPRGLIFRSQQEGELCLPPPVQALGREGTGYETPRAPQPLAWPQVHKLASATAGKGSYTRPPKFSEAHRYAVTKAKLGHSDGPRPLARRGGDPKCPHEAREPLSPETFMIPTPWASRAAQKGEFMPSLVSNCSFCRFW